MCGSCNSSNDLFCVVAFCIVVTDVLDMSVCVFVRLRWVASVLSVKFGFVLFGTEVQLTTQKKLRCLVLLIKKNVSNVRSSRSGREMVASSYSD